MKFPKSKIGLAFVAIYFLIGIITLIYSSLECFGPRIIDMGGWNKSKCIIYFAPPWLPWRLLEMRQMWIEEPISTSTNFSITSVILFIINSIFLYLIGYFLTCWLYKKNPQKTS